MTFEPGARTAWHTHPLGQTLIVTAGAGRVQRWGDPIRKIRAGDVVWIPPGQKHWHGAAPRTAMTHIAIWEQLGGKSADWMEPVSDEQYNGPVAAAADVPPPAETHCLQSVAPALAHYTERTFVGEAPFRLATLETALDEWSNKAYTPDIIGSRERPYTKRGYGPLK